MQHQTWILHVLTKETKEIDTRLMEKGNYGSSFINHKKVCKS